MVKNVFRILPVVALTLVLTAAMTMPDKAGAAVSAKKPKATNVQYFKEDGKKTGIKTFTIDTYTYYNMSKNKDLNPSQQSTMKLDDAALLRIAKKQIFPKWGLIAEEVFRDQANQLVTIEGKGMMSSRDSSKKTDFDRHFQQGRSQTATHTNGRSKTLRNICPKRHRSRTETHAGTRQGSQE